MYPNDPMAPTRARRQYQRGETYLSSGDLTAAAAAFEATLVDDPLHAAALLQLAALAQRGGQFGRARELTLQATRATIGSPGLALMLIRQLVAVGEAALVIDLCSQLPPAMWDSALSLSMVAQQLSRVGAHRMARGYAQAAIARDPRHPPSLYMAANLEVYFGEVERAAELLERALALDPNQVDAHWLLSRLRQPDPRARVVRIERALTRVAPGEDEAFLAYALHNELHEARDYPRAWAALERACRAKRQVLNYDAAATKALFTQLQQWTADEVAQARGCEERALTPIFIVGMHRSGTTLVERILGGHPQITAAGETYELPNQLRRASGHSTSAALDAAVLAARNRMDDAQVGAGYLKAMRWRAREQAFVTDKLPSNFLNIGFIAQALPHARIVHVRRDPIDVGLSNLRTLFTGACPYSYDQQEFVDYYGWYSELMAHWHRLLPGRILDVQYEDVVADPLAAATRLSEFCGVSVVPEMIDIGRSTDPVATASSVLVRDGIRRDRSRLWAAYAEQLAPMLQAFGASAG